MQDCSHVCPSCGNLSKQPWVVCRLPGHLDRIYGACLSQSQLTNISAALARDTNLPQARWCKILQLTLKGDLRGHLLELMACMGVRIQKAMDPNTITHVVAADVECRDSQKLNIARSFQYALLTASPVQASCPPGGCNPTCPRVLRLPAACRSQHQIWLLNCLWMYDSIRCWRMQDPGAAVWAFS